MVSVQNFREHNQFQTGMGFGFDETMKEKVHSTDWLMRHEKNKIIKTSKSNKFLQHLVS
jgi:hypothetical protein